MVYVEPLYLRSEQGQIPELKRVIVAYDDRLAMEPTLEAALAARVRARRGARRSRRRRSSERRRPADGPAAAPPRRTAATTRRARDHYRAALDALRAGDWAGFGREMDALGKALEQ